jgi:hypothetical protein
MMTKTHNTRIKTITYTLAGLAAFAGLLALVIWTITPTEQGSGIAPQSPVDITTYWIIVAAAIALTFLVILPVSTLLAPKLMRRWTHRADDSASRV